MKKIRVIVVVFYLFGAIAQAGTEKKIIRSPQRLPDTYLIVFEDKQVPKKDVDKEARGMAEAHGGRVRFVFESALRGFSARMGEAAAQAILRNPKVLSVEEVGQLHLASVQYLPSDDRLWHLDRIDQKTPTTTGDDSFYYCEKGRDVVAYVLDTGINRDHSEFLRFDNTSRVVNGVNFASDTWVRYGEAADYGTFPCGGWTNVWPNSYRGGHGTSVASLIGGNSLGSAKNVTLVPVKVASCAGDPSVTDRMTAGLDWIASSQNPRRAVRPAVVNISMFAWTSDGATIGLERAVRYLSQDQLDDNGNVAWTAIPVVVSATNYNENPYDRGPNPILYTPARLAFSNSANVPGAGRVISVGGMAANETRWSCPEAAEQCETLTLPNFATTNAGSNWGPTVDIYAPAHAIESAHISGSNDVRTVEHLRSGTSFAAPIVAGVVARILQVHGPITPAGVYSILVQDAQAVTFEPNEGPKPMLYRGGYSWCWSEYP